MTTMTPLTISARLFFVLQTIPRASWASPGGKDCRVDAFPTQAEFNAEAYQGHWYGISINSYWLQIPFFSDWFPPTDIQAVYTVNEDGDIRIASGGSAFLGFGCMQNNGVAVAPNKDLPQKREVTFPGSLLGWIVGRKPYWILRTDYSGFAVVYACWGRAEDGTCASNNAFLWTLNRDPKGHSPEQLVIIREVVSDVCIDPDKLKTIKQTGKCKLDANESVKTEF